MRHPPVQTGPGSTQVGGAPGQPQCGGVLVRRLALEPVPVPLRGSGARARPAWQGRLPMQSPGPADRASSLHPADRAACPARRRVHRPGPPARGMTPQPHDARRCGRQTPLATYLDRAGRSPRTAHPEPGRPGPAARVSVVVGSAREQSAQARSAREAQVAWSSAWVPARMPVAQRKAEALQGPVEARIPPLSAPLARVSQESGAAA